MHKSDKTIQSFPSEIMNRMKSHHGSVNISVSYCSISQSTGGRLTASKSTSFFLLLNPLPTPTSLTFRGCRTHAPHLSNLGLWENERSYFTALYLFSYQFIGFLFSTIFFYKVLKSHFCYWKQISDKIQTNLSHNSFDEDDQKKYLHHRRNPLKGDIFSL